MHIGNEAPLGANVKLGADAKLGSKAWGKKEQPVVNLYDGLATFSGIGYAQIELKAPLTPAHKVRIRALDRGIDVEAIVEINGDSPRAEYGQEGDNPYVLLESTGITIKLGSTYMGGGVTLVIDDLGEIPLVDFFNGAVALTERQMGEMTVMAGTFEVRSGIDETKPVYTYINGTCYGAGLYTGAEAEIDGYHYMVGIDEEVGMMAATDNLSMTSMSVRIAQEA